MKQRPQPSASPEDAGRDVVGGSEDADESAEARFAEALATALGPLYRVLLEAPDGTIEGSYGAALQGRSLSRAVKLPSSPRSLIIEVDSVDIAAATRVVQALSRVCGFDVAPRGTFTHVDDVLGELLAAAQAEIGRPIADMSRAEKQRLVRFLDERGAFSLRKSVEAVADILGVSRFTVYNYLDSVRRT